MQVFGGFIALVCYFLIERGNSTPDTYFWLVLGIAMVFYKDVFKILTK
jgi:hypothetical protein